jgi:parallel beta-helix repeat protein
MKRLKFLSIGVLVLGLIFFVSGKAFADDCGALGGSVVPVPLPVLHDECQISIAVPGTITGPFTLNETLHFLTGGSIRTGAGGITLDITAGDFIMDAGSLIDGNVAGCETGGPISITVENGDVVLKPGSPGSIIRSNSCQGGAIEITTGDKGNIDIDGLVESVGSNSGTGNQAPGGGTITIIAACDLTITPGGKVSSRGADPGADLVHLEGCIVEIFGIVESTASGHVIPNNPPNHCNLQSSAHPIGNGPSTGFTGCVEVWSGTTILIDSTGTNKGEINADIGITGGTQGRGWIDLFANGDITIKDGTGNNHTYDFGGGCKFASTFAVHSNGGLCQNTDDGGLITVKSTGGDVVASGNALQADATSSGSNGGEIRVEANQNINFNGGSIFARGDFAQAGGFGFGGEIGTLAAPTRAFNGSLSWTSGTGDVRPTGADTLHPVDVTAPSAASGKRGIIFLQDCLAPAGVTLGATFPFNGNMATTPTVVPDACDATQPKLPDYVTLPSANCQTTCQGGCKGSITIIKTCVGGDSTTKFDFTDDIVDPFGFSLGCDAASNTKTFPDLDPGTYTVTETVPDGWNLNIVCVDPTNNTVVQKPTAHIHLDQLDDTCENITCTFTNSKTACKEDPGRAAFLTRTVDTSKPAGGGDGTPGNPINYLTVQAAYDAAKISPITKDEVIGLFSKTIENVTLGNYTAKSMTLTQCTSAQVTAAIAAPVWDLTATKKLLIISPDAVGGTIGWRVFSNGHELKSIRADGASDAGIKVLGSNNNISWNDADHNNLGVDVYGSKNTLKGGSVSFNTTFGVHFGGTASTNTLSGATIESNGSHGVFVEGTGTGNIIKSNKANSNKGDGFNNSATDTPSNNFSGNSSNTGGKENIGAEYRFVAAGINGGSNRADGVNVPSAAKGCTSFNAGQVCE